MMLVKLDWSLFNQSRLSFDGDGIWLYVRRPGSFNEVPLFYQELETIGM